MKRNNNKVTDWELSLIQTQGKKIKRWAMLVWYFFHASDCIETFYNTKKNAKMQKRTATMKNRNSTFLRNLL